MPDRQKVHRFRVALNCRSVHPPSSHEASSRCCNARHVVIANSGEYLQVQRAGRGQRSTGRCRAKPPSRRWSTIVAPEPSASPARKVSPAKEKVNSSAASRSGGAPSRSQAQATSSGDIDARMCQGFRRRYEEARNMPCIMAVQEGTGKQMCMPEAHRTAFIANLRALGEAELPLSGSPADRDRSGCTTGKAISPCGSW